MGSCPYVFIREINTNQWCKVGTIISDCSGKKKESWSELILPLEFDGRMIIKELDPEKSFIKELYILAELYGHEVCINSSHPLLGQDTDGYLIMDHGDSLEICFEINREYKNIRLISYGYFDTYPASVFVPVEENPAVVVA